MSNSHPQDTSDKNILERGQAIVEYALIAVLVGIAFGLALAASAPVTGNLFNAVVNDLLQQTLIADSSMADATQFWNTVTKVAQYTPGAGSLPTNTPAIPTLTPTDGPSPTPTNTYTPTNIIPSATPTLTSTPPDDYKEAPFIDTVDEPGWWRIDNNVALGGLPWKAEYFNNKTLTGPVAYTVNGIWEIDYANNFAPGFSGEDNFSARFTRTVQFANDTTLNFRLRADDGVRLFVNGAPIQLRNASGNNANGWVDQSATTYTAAVNFTGGNVSHTIVVEYYESSGDAVLSVALFGGGANPDDKAINSAGAPNPSGTYSCEWGPIEDENDANTERKLFDNYVSSPNGVAGSLCHLEWRGAVVIDPAHDDMVLSFWDVWEFDNPGVDGWVEIAEYKPVNPNAYPPVLDRAAMEWTKISLNRAGTANFNWTNTIIPLGPLMSGWSEPRRLAFRFVMQIPSGVTADRRWFIDDIEFKRREPRVYALNKLWTLDNADERFDFIRTGATGQSNPGERSGWNLVSNNKFGPTGLAFHDSADSAYDSQTAVAGTNGSNFTRYKKFSLAPVSSNFNDMRINSLEIDGFINLNDAPNPDMFGNTGSRVLSFYHGYDLGPLTGLYVQYSTSAYGPAPATWTTFPEGMLRDGTVNGTARQLNLQESVISLEGLPGNPSQIRIRFIMTIHAQSTPADGWWIDHIRLGRAETNRWLNYPLYDQGQLQEPILFWRYTGTWAPTADRGRARIDAAPGDAEISYASSPTGNYAHSQEMYLTTRWPIDLYNDTPNKTVLVAGTGAIDTTNSFGGPAINPVLTFYWWRELGTGDDFYVQWRRANSPDSPANWTTIWTKTYAMGTNTNNVNKSWEPARVSLYPILKKFAQDGNGAPGVGTGTQLTDDDIYIRFVLKTDGSNAGPGIWIDDIAIQENNVWTWKLWPSNENRNDPSVASSPPSLGFGSGTTFFSEPDGVVDGRPYNDDWTMGGFWGAVDWEQRGDQGMYSFHDSPIGGQTRAPTGMRISGSNDYGETAWRTPHQTYGILELNRAIDLRATRLAPANEAPMLSFWTRYHIGRQDYIRVQVSEWDPRQAAAIGSTQANALDTAMVSRCANIPGMTQCYENERGWGPWTNVWEVGSTSAAVLSYGWRKISVNLSTFAYNPNTATTPGKIIRIRFLYYAYTNSTNADGWYVDRVEVTHRPAPLTFNVNTTNFEDKAESMTNWIGEGSWGLDPNIFVGGSGLPVNLGVWRGKWWYCPNANVSGFPRCNGSGSNTAQKYANGAKDLLNQTNRPAPAHTIDYTGIGINYPDGISPVPGWTRSGSPVHNEVVAEFTTDINVDGVYFLPGPRTFIVRSDEGVRLKIEELDSNGVPIVNSPVEWNIIDNWTAHVAATDIAPTPAALSFVLGRRYRLTLQHYDRTGAGLIQLNANQPRYSYSDSPKYSGPLTQDVPALPWSNTSLLGRLPFNLTAFNNTNFPGMAIQTKYRLQSDSDAVVEVSTDGGFTWSSNNLNVDVTNTAGSLIWDSVSPTFDGMYGMANPDTDPWELRLYNLNAYEGNHVLIRFRLDRTATSCYRGVGNDNATYASNNSNCTGPGSSPNFLAEGYYDGWWIGNIRIQRVGN